MASSSSSEFSYALYTATTWHDKDDYVEALLDLGDNNYVVPQLHNDSEAALSVIDNEGTDAWIVDIHSTGSILQSIDAHGVNDDHASHARPVRGCQLNRGKGGHPYELPNLESELDMWRHLIPGGLSKGGKGYELDGRGPAMKIAGYDETIRLADWISPAWRNRVWKWQGQPWKIIKNAQTGLDQWELSSEIDRN